MNIVEALDDPNLFGRYFSGESRATWKAVLKAAFALPLPDCEMPCSRLTDPLCQGVGARPA